MTASTQKTFDKQLGSVLSAKRRIENLGGCVRAAHVKGLLEGEVRMMK